MASKLMVNNYPWRAGLRLFCALIQWSNVLALHARKESSSAPLALGYDLNKEQFWDVINIPHTWTLPELPSANVSVDRNAQSNTCSPVKKEVICHHHMT